MKIVRTGELDKRGNSPARAVNSRDSRADSRSPVKAASKVNVKRITLALPQRGFFYRNDSARSGIRWTRALQEWGEYGR